MRITVRLTEESNKKLEAEVARSGTDNSKSINSMLSSFPDWDWVILAKTLGDEFLDELAFTTKSRDHDIWAAHLKAKLNNQVSQETNSYSNWKIRITPNQDYRPYQGENDWEENLIIETLDGKRWKRITKADPEWKHFVKDDTME